MIDEAESGTEPISLLMAIGEFESGVLARGPLDDGGRCESAGQNLHGGMGVNREALMGGGSFGPGREGFEPPGQAMVDEGFVIWLRVLFLVQINRTLFMEGRFFISPFSSGYFALRFS